MQYEYDEITGTEEILYLDDIKTRIAYLEDPGDTDPGDCTAELAELREVVSEINDYGYKLIHETHMADYAQERAESVMGSGADTDAWPFNHIDWDAAADEMRNEMGDVTLFGETYYVD